jgi:hypothetical protein
MKKPKLYVGKSIEGETVISTKIDGVRAKLCPVTKTAISFNGKPLYGLDDVLNTITTEMDVEIFCGSFKQTVEIVRCSKNLPRQITIDEIYSINPLDSRLHVHTVDSPTPELIEEYLQWALKDGNEGLVLTTPNKWLKVKSSETHDVVITELIEGTGQFEGCLGAFMTSKGKVGTGFTHTDRKDYYREDLVGSVIEVECMELTDAGKFRHPRFIRLRFDKDAKHCKG